MLYNIAVRAGRLGLNRCSFCNASGRPAVVFVIFFSLSLTYSAVIGGKNSRDKISEDLFSEIMG